MPIVETNTRKIIRRLEAEGWVNVGGGEHDRFKHPTRQDMIILPRHRELSMGVARRIAKQAGWI